ncbi:hypothetical protein [Priestia megaterium]|uniref:Uncharacterized protein n=1 Tax=Priestia megaterium TaxID=1404 RepID=A0A6M6E1X0_PRIMG|nr:hypothetical protein [Priestia megaterium]QJX80942.1 hypothetical protein FDZ14_33160 [Priestia megaterium]
MQGYIGLVRYSCGTVHSFNLDKGLKSLCGNKFGLGEKITWGNPSEVTCASCQEILYEKYETDFSLNDQHCSLEYSTEDDTNYNIPYSEDSIPEAEDSYEPQLTEEEETAPSMTLESADTTANTEDSIIIFSDFEEDNLESEAEHQPRNESNNNISIVEDGKDGILEVDDSYTFQSTSVEEMYKEILEEVASSVETDSVNTTVTNEPSNKDSSDLEKNNLEVDSEDNSNNTDDNTGNLDNLDHLDEVEDLNINEEAEEPVIILI